MASGKIESIKIRGFRSLADVEISDMPQATVLIGANGSGKSNFLRFFQMLSLMLKRRLGEFIERGGGADDHLFEGAAVTNRICGEIGLCVDERTSRYRFVLNHADPDRFFFGQEALNFNNVSLSSDETWYCLGSEHRESMLVESSQSDRLPPEGVAAARTIINALYELYHNQFNISSAMSSVQKPWDVDDNYHLHMHGANLAPVLYRLEQEDVRRYDLICQQIGRILPIFDRFVIRERNGRVSLRWKARGIDKTFGPHLTSDGSLRFFALVTLLNLPPEMLSQIVLLDEPELGLHPAAIALIGGLIKSVSVERQVIVATQSPILVDAFDLDQIIVADLERGRTILRKLNPDDYRVWLEDRYTPGDLWRKNLIGGRP